MEMSGKELLHFFCKQLRLERKALSTYLGVHRTSIYYMLNPKGEMNPMVEQKLIKLKQEAERKSAAETIPLNQAADTIIRASLPRDSGKREKKIGPEKKTSKLIELIIHAISVKYGKGHTLTTAVQGQKQTKIIVKDRSGRLKELYFLYDGTADGEFVISVIDEATSLAKYHKLSDENLQVRLLADDYMSGSSLAFIRSEDDRLRFRFTRYQDVVVV
jgi:hypothetical protein